MMSGAASWSPWGSVRDDSYRGRVGDPTAAGREVGRGHSPDANLLGPRREYEQGERGRAAERGPVGVELELARGEAHAHALGGTGIHRDSVPADHFERLVVPVADHELVTRETGGGISVEVELEGDPRLRRKLLEVRDRDANVHNTRSRIVDRYRAEIGRLVPVSYRISVGRARRGASRGRQDAHEHGGRKDAEQPPAARPPHRFSPLRRWVPSRVVPTLSMSTRDVSIRRRLRESDGAEPARLRRPPTTRREEARAEAWRSVRERLGKLDDRLVFVVGSPRSGTTFLAGAIGSLPGFVDLGEVAPVKAAVPELASLEPEEAARRLRRILAIARRVGLVGSVRAVEQTPELAHLVAVLPLAYPHARIVHIVRDGRDVACSLLEKPWLRAQQARSDDAGIAYGSYARFWVEPDRREEFERATDARRAAWVWRRYVTATRNARSRPLSRSDTRSWQTIRSRPRASSPPTSTRPRTHSRPRSVVPTRRPSGGIGTI